MRKALVRAVAAGAVVGAGVLAAAPAHANTFTEPFRHGIVKYEDGKDLVCVHGANGYAASVTVKPVNGVGPSFTVRDAAGGKYWTCSDGLKYAYEDSRYSWRAVSYNNEVIGGSDSGRFWS